MKKIRSTIFIFASLALIGYIAYRYLNHKEVHGTERCADCALMDNDTLTRMVGTVAIAANQWLFTDRLTNATYRLIPCDQQCGREEVSHFDKINLNDPVTKKQLYFDIEGKYIPEKDEFMYRTIFILEERVVLDPEAIKRATLNQIKEKYTPLEEDSFSLNKSHYAGLRAFLPHYFTKAQLKQAIPLKEATWETSDSTLITIWFEQKTARPNQWQPIKQYEWTKGTEF